MRILGNVATVRTANKAHPHRRIGAAVQDRGIPGVKSPRDWATQLEEGRELARGNSPERSPVRTQGRANTLGALERVRQAPRKEERRGNCGSLRSRARSVTGGAVED